MLLVKALLVGLNWGAFLFLVLTIIGAYRDTVRKDFRQGIVYGSAMALIVFVTQLLWPDHAFSFLMIVAVGTILLGNYFMGALPKLRGWVNS